MVEKSEISLLPQLPDLPFLVNGGPLSSHPPQLPGLPFTLRRSNAVRHCATGNILQLSSKFLRTTDVQDAAVPELPFTSKNTRHRRKLPARNPSMLTQHPDQRKVLPRYYTSALSADDQAALIQGEKNYNLKAWTEKDFTSFQESRKALLPLDMYIGPDQHAFVIPLIILTEGQTQRAHIQQLRKRHDSANSDSTTYC